MFESFLAVPLHFTVEFLGFLVVAGGALLVLARPALGGASRVRRVGTAAALAALAVGQVLHGSSAIEDDAGPGLVALRAVAYLLLAVTAGNVASSGTSAPAVAGWGPQSLAAPAAAALLTLSAFIRWIRGGPRSLVRLAVAGALFAAGELVTANAAGSVLDSGAPDAFAVAGHVVRVLGYFALASWLWTGVQSSIRARFVASFVALLVAVVLALSTALTGVISNNVEDAELTRVVDQARNVVAGIERDRVRSLLAQVKQIAPSVMAAPEALSYFSAKGSDLQDLANDIIELDLFSADFVIFRRQSDLALGAGGRGPAVTNERGNPKTTRLEPADVVKILGSDIVTEVFGEAPNAASLDRIEDSVVVLAASDIGEPRAIGTVVIGQYVDAFTTEEISNSLRPAKASLVVDGKVPATEIEGLSDEPIIPRDALSEMQSTGGAVAQQQTLADRAYYSAFAPLERADGFIIGHLVLSSPARIVAQARGTVTRTLFVVAMGVGAIALILAWLSGRRITRPIQELTATARRVREGQLDVKVAVAGVDEVGQLGETFNEMTSALSQMTNDLREAAREEHRLRARIETIIQSMADGLIAVDANRKILAFNREAEHLTGFKARRVLGKPVDEIVQVADAQGRPVHLPIFDLAAGSTIGVSLATRDGGSVPVAVTSAVLLAEEQQVAGAVAVIRDMTREREVERMKSEFLSNISHELRTPLTPIKGYAELLQRKALPPERVQQFVDGILESTERLERIVELLVDFAALEAGRLSPRSTPVDIAQMLETIAAEWEQRTPRHRVIADVKPRLPRIMGDERLLRRSIEEVLDNAIKFSPEGGTIKLEGRGKATGNGDGRRRYVAVTVVDEGIGITPNDLDKIFSDFRQLDGSETRSYGGLGLGLAFVQRIVEAHDGVVDVESEPDEGTRFTITIPAIQRPARGR